MALCVCGSGIEGAGCCLGILANGVALTAEALMRARYSAYVTGNVDFLERTCAPEALEEFSRVDAEHIIEEVKWLGLEIKRVEAGGAEDQTGLVEFVFHFNRGGEKFFQHELSQFCRGVGGEWLYKDSEINPKPATVRVDKVGRNDPCVCGSGKKFKKCCGG